ncbi:MAG: hypothetical protein HUK22_07645, partial [Thermoguttaceae bacterium]|nr:hypothetical protein [Thermoguttaceae bacterium]
MARTRKETRDARRESVLRLSEVLFGKKFASAALLTACAFFAVGTGAFGQTVSGKQLTISENTRLRTISDDIKSVLFTGDYVLTLSEPQDVAAVFLSQSPGKGTIALEGTSESADWTFNGNSSGWSGTTIVGPGASLAYAAGVSNPGGAYTSTGAGAYATTVLTEGATLKVSAVGSGEVKIGALATGRYVSPGNATVDVDGSNTLSVYDGLAVVDSVELIKTGTGTLQLLANGSKTETTGGKTKTAPATTFELGLLGIKEGTFRIKSGTGDVNSASITAHGILVNSGATLDIQKCGTIELTGSAGETVFYAGDASTVNIYVNQDGNTCFKATSFNTYIQLESATINIIAEQGTSVPQTMTIFTAEGVGQTTYDVASLRIQDNFIGRRYVVDEAASNSEKLVVKTQEATKFASLFKKPNEIAVGGAIDRKVASGKYTAEEYKILEILEANQKNLDVSSLTGEIHASTVGYAYLNNFMMQRALFSVLRSNTLTAYSNATAGATSSSTAPTNYQQTNINTSAPAGVQNGGVVEISPPAGYGYNGYPAGAQPGYYGAQLDAPSYSTLETIRAQAEYGDPGTLIYSAWLTGVAGNLKAKDNDCLGYDGKKSGFLAGLDVFGSCDC